MNKITESSLIAVLEDDPQVARIIDRALVEFGFRTKLYPNSVRFLNEVANLAPSLCVVDLYLPDMDGIEVIDRLRETYSCGILILTSRIGVDECVEGLEHGADDYVVKPFDTRELVARVRSVLRRCRVNLELKARRIACFGEWTFNIWTNSLSSASGQSHELSVQEAETLFQFLSNPKRVISRDKLSPIPDAGHFDRTIDVRISRLRGKLEANPHTPELIRTIYGLGYVFTADVTWKTELDYESPRLY